MLQVAMEICRNINSISLWISARHFFRGNGNPLSEDRRSLNPVFLAIFVVPCSLAIIIILVNCARVYVFLWVSVDCLSDYALRSKYAKDNQRKQTDGAGNGDRVRCINCTNIHIHAYDHICAHISQHISKYIHTYIYIGIDICTYVHICSQGRRELHGSLASLTFFSHFLHSRFLAFRLFWGWFSVASVCCF